MKRSVVLPSITVVAGVIALVMIFFYAPTEAVQGHVQRLFYFHVPSAWLAFIAFFVVAAASVMVLVRRNSNEWERWDRIAASTAEVGLLFTSLCLATGPIWAKRAWGVWWAWDVRLTSTLVLWLIYAGYVLFRSMSPAGERRARLCAVIGIVGVTDVPLVHFAVTWWNSAHPAPTVLRPGGPDLPGEMTITLLVAFIAWALLMTWFVRTRLRIEEGRSVLEARTARSAHV